MIGIYCVCYPISACLVGSAVGAAAISIDDVSIIADFTFVSFNETIAAATDINADVLFGGACLSGIAAPTCVRACVGRRAEQARAAYGCCRNDRDNRDHPDVTTPSGIMFLGAMHDSPSAQWLTYTVMPSMLVDAVGTTVTI